MATVLVTGINSGMGFVTAQKLLQQGYTVLGTIRNREKSQGALSQLSQFSEGRLVTYEMNLESLKSVDRCAREIYNNHSHTNQT